MSADAVVQVRRASAPGAAGPGRNPSRRLALALAARAGGILAVFAVKVATLPVILAAIGDHAYGDWVIALQAVDYLVLARLGFPVAEARLLASSAGRPEERSHLSSFFALNLLLGGAALVLTLVLYAVLRWALGLDSAARLFVWMGIVGSLAVPFSSYAIFLQAGLLEAASETATLIATLVQGVVTVVVLKSGLGLWGLVVAQGAFTLVQAVALSLAFRAARGPFRPDWSLVRKKTVQAILPASAYLGLNLLSVLVFYATDGFIIGAALGSEEVMRYDLSGKLPLVVIPLIFAGTDIFFPWIARADSWEALKGLYLRVLTGTLWVTGWIAALYYFFATPLLRAWTGRSDIAVPSTLAALFAAFFAIQCIIHVGAVFLQARGEVKTLSWLSVGAALVNLVLSVALVRPCGIAGVILASVLVTMAGNGRYVPLHLQKLMGIPNTDYFRLAFRHLLVPFVLVGLAYAVVDPRDWGRAAIISLAVGLSALYLGLSLCLLGPARLRQLLSWFRLEERP